MIKNNTTKIFSMSGISFITKIHDGNFGVITMNGVLKFFSGKKPFNCLKTKQVTKGAALYNLKEIFFKNSKKDKIYLILYEKEILIFSIDNKYQKCFLLQKIFNDNYIGALSQLSCGDVIFWDKKNRINLLKYSNGNKVSYNNEIIQTKIIGKDIKISYIVSLMECNNNEIITTSTSKHPLGEDAIRIYKIENNSKLKSIMNFNGYSCAIFENNITKLQYQKTICIALNYIQKNGIIIHNSSILMFDYEYMQINTILEVDLSLNSIFNFSIKSYIGNYERIYEYIMISKYKIESNSNTKKKGPDNFRYLEFYVFEPKNEYLPLLIKNIKITTNSSIDITNSFLINKNNLVVYQTDQVSIYFLST